MFEALLAVLACGFCLSFRKAKNTADPFLLYFSQWLFVFALIYFDKHSYINFSNIFLAFMLLLKLFSLLVLVAIYSIEKPKGNSVFSVKTKDQVDVETRRVDFALIMALIFLPIIYFKALNLSGGIDIFSVVGYVALRSSMTDDTAGFGFYAYVMLMTYVATSVRFLVFLQGGRGGWFVVLGFTVALCYVYLSTSRTSALLFFVLMVVPGILIEKLKFKSILLVLVILILSFALIAAMTAKGFGADSSFDDNFFSIFESLRSYVSAPILAFNLLFEDLNYFDFGQNTFRVGVVALNSLGLIDLKPVSLIRDFVGVPWLTNVYTVYEVYYKDFFIIGLFAPCLFLIFHFWLYGKAIRLHGRWLFFYAASVYPLLMQFFQDQYFSLISMNLQIFFWCWLFFGFKKFKRFK